MLEPSEELLRLRNLSVQFTIDARTKLEAITGVNLTVRTNEAHGLIGESGSGKSVTALAALGLLGTNARVRGDLSWRGRDISQLSEREWQRIRGRGMTMLFQDALASLNPALRIGSQLERVVRRHQEKSKSEAWREAISLLRAVNMPDPERVMNALPYECSGGMAQRAALAMALACEPELLIADEPTSALDATIAAQILELLKQIRAKRRLALLVISHDLSVVARTCETVSVMYLGKIVETGPTQTVLSSPRHPYTAALLAAAVWSVTPPAEPVRPLLGEPPSLLNPPSGCRFHPRCPYVLDVCRDKEPPMNRRSVPEHISACWFYDKDMRMP